MNKLACCSLIVLLTFASGSTQYWQVASGRLPRRQCSTSGPENGSLLLVFTKEGGAGSCSFLLGPLSTQESHGIQEKAQDQIFMAFWPHFISNTHTHAVLCLFMNNYVHNQVESIPQKFALWEICSSLRCCKSLCSVCAADLENYPSGICLSDVWPIFQVICLGFPSKLKLFCQISAANWIGKVHSTWLFPVYTQPRSQCVLSMSDWLPGFESPLVETSRSKRKHFSKVPQTGWHIQGLFKPSYLNPALSDPGMAPLPVLPICQKALALFI